MEYFGLLLLLMLALLLIAVKYMGILAGLLYFVCAAACGIFVFITFCAIKAAIYDEDQQYFDDWS